MTKVVRIHAYGGTDVLSIENDEIGAPGPGEVLLDQKGMALHFADTMLREGMYFLKPELPAVVGLDGAGIVEAVGPGVTAFKPGDAAAQRGRVHAQHRRRPGQPAGPRHRQKDPHVVPVHHRAHPCILAKQLWDIGAFDRKNARL